jgi:hypothetical protein
MFSYTLFLTSALEGGEELALLPGRTLPLGKTWYPLYRRLEWPRGFQEVKVPRFHDDGKGWC